MLHHVASCLVGPCKMYISYSYCLSAVVCLQALKVCVTGAAGQIAYSLLYSIANGDVFGKDQVKPLSQLVDALYSLNFPPSI